MKNKVYIITPTYVFRLGFAIKQTIIKAQKIDKSFFNIYKMIIAGFKLQNKLKRFDFSRKLFHQLIIVRMWFKRYFFSLLVR